LLNLSDAAVKTLMRESIGGPLVLRHASKRTDQRITTCSPKAGTSAGFSSRVPARPRASPGCGALPAPSSRHQCHRTAHCVSLEEAKANEPLGSR
jgi:hypothetical protein